MKLYIQKAEYNSLISFILDGNHSNQQFNKFINLCISISAAYLKTELYYNRVYFPIIYKNENDLKDISLDLIAPLFKRDDTDSFPIFKQCLLSDINGYNNDSLYNRLKSVIISKTKQELIERYKKEEPGGYKILRNIRLAPTRNNNIKVHGDQSKTYFYYFDGECQEPVIDYLNTELPEIEEEELLEIIRIICKKHTVIPKILEFTLINIRKNNSCRDFVRISTLFKAIKKVMLFKTIPLDSIIGHNGYSHNQNGDDYNSRIFEDINKCISLAIKDKYLKKDKIDKQEADYYKSVLNEYFKDMIFAQTTNPLPHYLNNGYSDLITDGNFALHKNRINYLIKLCKNNLGQIISKN